MCCNNNMGFGNNWWWVIILILLFCNCGGCGNGGNTWNGNCGCDNDRCGCC